MNHSRRLWTPEEDRLLKETVQDFVKEGKPKREAFEEAARLIKRSPGTCSQRYYSKLSKKPAEMSLEMCISFLQGGLNSDYAKEHHDLIKEKEQLLVEQMWLKRKYDNLKMMQAVLK